MFHCTRYAENPYKLETFTATTTTNYDTEVQFIVKALSGCGILLDGKKKIVVQKVIDRGH